MNQNKTTKYLKYAIGEIILVMVGILLALQVNNWNEDKKLNQKEINVAKEIHSELVQNLELVKKQLKLWELRNANVFKVSDFIASENQDLTNKEFDSTMLYVIGFNNFQLKTSKFNRIIASENFEFKRSKQIITDMLSLDADYKRLTAYYEFNLNNYYDIVQPYLIKNYSYRNFADALNSEKNDSRVDYRELLSDIEFDNVIQSVIGNNAPFVFNIEKTIKNMEAFKSTLEDVYPIIKNLED